MMNEIDRQIVVGAKRAVFDAIFTHFAGYAPDKAPKDTDGSLLLPETVRDSQPRLLRRTLAEVADHNWRNRIVNDQYSGTWIKRP